MRWGIALGWVLVATAVRAEVPMDLDSPFEKVALIRSKTGEIEKREIKKARLTGVSVEMEKMEGGVAIFPIKDVLAILPLLPKGEPSGNAQNVERVLHLLRTASPDLMREAGLGAVDLSEWEKIKERLDEAKKRQDEQSQKDKEASSKKEVESWLGQAGELRTPRTGNELADLKQAGEALARKNPEQMDVILEVLAALSQVQSKEKGEPLPDLVKLNENRSQMAPDDFMGWLTGGVLILSFFGLLFGLGFLSSSATRFKEGALLGGIGFAVLGLGLLGLLVWTWLPAGVEGQKIPPRVDPKMEELGLYLKNRAKPVYYFPQRQFSFSLEDWRSGVLGYLPVSDESQGMFKVKMKEGTLLLADHLWIWRQPLTALGIPLPIFLTFSGKIPDLKEWENPEISKVCLGRWSLPESVRGLLIDSAINIWRQGLSSVGLAGVKLELDEHGMLMVAVPAAGLRPKYEMTKEVLGTSYKKEISAEELFQKIEKGSEKEFIGKFILLEGFVIKIESGSEVSGALSAGKSPSGLPGVSSAQEKVPGIEKRKSISFGQADYDKFYIAVERPLPEWSEGKKTKCVIKCLIKSDLVFVQDKDRGDIYVGPSADTINREPLIKWGQRIRFLTEGRVEGWNRFGDFEIYGMRLDETTSDKVAGLQVFDPNEEKAR